MYDEELKESEVVKKKKEFLSNAQLNLFRVTYKGQLYMYKVDWAASS